MQKLLKVISKDEKTGFVESFKFTHTNHSFQRSSQRGINNDQMAKTILYGEPYYKQGLIYYVLGEKQIPKQYQKNKESLKNTIVIVDGQSDTVITCYRSKAPFKHIRRKSSILIKNY